MTTYNHGCSLGFEVISKSENGEDITPDMYRIAIKKRIDLLDQTNSWDMAIDIFDTFEEITDYEIIGELKLCKP